MMRHFQRVTRTSYYPHDVLGEGFVVSMPFIVFDCMVKCVLAIVTFCSRLDHCYDCAAEIHIWREYLLRYGSDDEKSQMSQSIALMSQLLSTTIDRALTLAI